VAIAPDCLLTSNHQGGGINTTVYFDSVPYKVKEEWRVPAGLASADLRVCRIETNQGEPANLSHYTPPFTGAIDVGAEVVLGGFGDGRGATLTTNEIPYGYLHDTSQNNTIQRWGTNKVNGSGIALVGLDPLSIIFYVFADFDGLGEGDATFYEAMVVKHDSGGGWFIKDQETWKVAGINYGAEIHDPPASWFRDPNNPSVLDPNDPDVFLSTRVNFYASWICTVLVTGDVNGDCEVTLEDVAAMERQWQRIDCSPGDNHCFGADIDEDGIVAVSDFILMGLNWLERYNLDPGGG
jgi:hypothetical protein